MKTYTREFFVRKGRKGGKAGFGPVKARTSEQARKAALAMHAKRRERLAQTKH